MRSQQNKRTRLKRRRKNARRPNPNPTPTPQAAFGLIAALAQPLIPKKHWVGLLGKTKQS
jgi:hypothetical protein